MNKLARSRTNRKVAGVLGGLSKSIGLNPSILRVIFIVLLFTTGVFPMALIYALLVFVLPNEEVL
ncbi:PspC domain-containing protein [Cytobacillus sp. NCCP-133]|uniref:PspC domain-containing protein n=1 Tax=Cytobacillus sp. NCCP-133 TaxID=766848 RepID=UPI00222F52B4|nr:PspC domain-containing protein [Cytobacillus sp. NCCP-133]GLB59822.1 putative membrane protein YvlC [Cytobacillus sp. NCCP-133]